MNEMRPLWHLNFGSPNSVLSGRTGRCDRVRPWIGSQAKAKAGRQLDGVNFLQQGSLFQECMMQVVLPKSWRARLARAGVTLGAIGCLAGNFVYGNDAVTLAEQAKQRLQNGTASAPAQTPAKSTYEIYQVSSLTNQDGAPIPATTYEAPAAPAAEAPADEPWGIKSFLPQGMQDKGYTIGGWTAVGVTLNPQGPRDGYNGPVTFQDQSNKLTLNQQYLFMEKATSTEDKDFDLGGRADIMYGTDARFTRAYGLEDSINGSQQQYLTALPQFYAEVAYKRTKTKIGHFYSPVGYFVVPTTGNFFNTLPYTFQYAEPFTHTGFLTTYQATDNLAIGGGLIRGWDNYDGRYADLLGRVAGHVGALGTLTYTFEDKSSLALVWVWSKEPTGIGSGDSRRDTSNRFLQTLVYQRALSDNVNYVFQSDYGQQSGVFDNFGGPSVGAKWYGVNQYLFYKQNDALTWGINFEWFRDEQGVRVGGFQPNFAPGNDGLGLSPANRYGYAGNFYQITMGPKWNVTPNFFVRPNLRFDWYSGKAATGALPFDDGTKGTQTLFATDFVLTY
jgi:hypothetical protein